MANEDKAGAKAFVEYYWAVVSYAQVTGDLAVLRRLSDKNCEPCSAGIQSVRKSVKGLSSATGGEKTTRVSSVAPLVADGNRSFKVEHTVRSAAQKLEYQDGSLRRYPAGKTPYSVVVELRDGTSWKLLYMETQG